MKIDLHVHSSTGSDGAFTVEEVFREARSQGITLLSITDHDSVDAQEEAIKLASEYGIAYLTGIELNVTFPISNDRSISLDFLGYRYDINDGALKSNLKMLRDHREKRAARILQNLNTEFERENIPPFTEADLKQIQGNVDGAFGRPHIADYLVEKGIVADRQEAFDKYLVKCDVPKYPLSLAEASAMIRDAGGILVLAHPSDPNGTSLIAITPDLKKQTEIIEKYMLNYVDGIECWHSKHSTETAMHYVEFARRHGLIATGGSDCHQKPVIMGSLDIPGWVASQFR